MMLTSYLLFFCWGIETVSASGSEKPVIHAASAVLLDVRTGQVLFSKNHRQPRPPASTTKILTTLLALEYEDLNTIVEVSSRAAGTKEASINLIAGEKLTLEELLYGALLKSGNDACVALGEHIGGTVENFVHTMNTKALLIGATDSNFVNTNGLPHQQHRSTALDLAMITRFAMQRSKFNEIIRTKYKIISYRGMKEGRYLKNTNKLLWQYPWADGVKTGTTNAAGKCLVASATRGDRRLIAVVLNSPERFGEAKKLLEYGFKNFTNLQVVSKGEVITKVTALLEQGTLIPLKARKDLYLTVPIKKVNQVERRLLINRNPVLPINEGQVLGHAVYCLNGRELGRVEAVSAISVNRKAPYGWWWRLKTFIP